MPFLSWGYPYTTPMPPLRTTPTSVLYLSLVRGRVRALLWIPTQLLSTFGCPILWSIGSEMPCPVAPKPPFRGGPSHPCLRISRRTNKL